MFEQLKKIRNEHGETCEMMATVIGLKTKSAYCKKENGNIPFSLEEAQLISRHYNLPIEDIFFENEVSKNEVSKMDTNKKNNSAKKIRPCGHRRKKVIVKVLWLLK